MCGRFAAWLAGGFLALVAFDLVVDVGSIWKLGVMAVAGAAAATWIGRRWAVNAKDRP